MIARGMRSQVFPGPPSGKDTRMLTTKVGYGPSGLLGAGIMFIGARFLLAPQGAGHEDRA